jgi:hypothetical protein
MRASALQAEASNINTYTHTHSFDSGNAAL